jgi:hypothetical protein
MFEHRTPTGRTFLVDSSEGGEIVGMAVNGASLAGDDPDMAIWTEYLADDGGLFYVSDHEDYTLDAEEFGPIPSDGEPTDDTPFGRGGDWCPWCGADWKAECEPDCVKGVN